MPSVISVWGKCTFLQVSTLKVWAGAASSDDCNRRGIRTLLSLPAMVTHYLHINCTIIRYKTTPVEINDFKSWATAPRQVQRTMFVTNTCHIHGERQSLQKCQEIDRHLMTTSNMFTARSETP